jgi:hypothetical protein
MYAINKEAGFVVSRVGNEVAWPVLQFDRIGCDGELLVAAQVDEEDSDADQESAPYVLGFQVT